MFSADNLLNHFLQYGSKLVILLAILAFSNHRNCADELNSYCAFNNTVTNVGCNMLELSCPPYSIIQLRNLQCGRSAKETPGCNQSSQYICSISINCCNKHAGDDMVNITTTDQEKLWNFCNNKTNCSLPIDVVKETGGKYKRHYCLFNYICIEAFRQHLSETTDAITSDNQVVKSDKDQLHQWTNITPQSVPVVKYNSVSETTLNPTALKRSTRGTVNKSSTTRINEKVTSSIFVPALVVPLIFILSVVVTGFLVLRWKRRRRYQRRSSVPPGSSQGLDYRLSIREQNKCKEMSFVETESCSGIRENKHSSVSATVCAKHYQNVPFKESQAHTYLILEPHDTYSHSSSQTAIPNNAEVDKYQSASNNEYDQIRFTNPSSRERHIHGTPNPLIASATEDVNYSHFDKRTLRCENKAGAAELKQFDNIFKAKVVDTENKCFSPIESRNVNKHIDFDNVPQSSCETKPESEDAYKKIVFIKSNSTSNLNYDALRYGTSNKGEENDAEYSHLEDGKVRSGNDMNYLNLVLKGTH